MSYLQELREREHARKQSRTWAAAASGQSGLPHQMLPSRQSGSSQPMVGRPVPDPPPAGRFLRVQVPAQTWDGPLQLGDVVDEHEWPTPGTIPTDGYYDVHLDVPVVSGAALEWQLDVGSAVRDGGQLWASGRLVGPVPTGPVRRGDGWALYGDGLEVGAGELVIQLVEPVAFEPVTPLEFDDGWVQNSSRDNGHSPSSDTRTITLPEMVTAGDLIVVAASVVSWGDYSPGLPVIGNIDSSLAFTTLDQNVTHIDRAAASCWMRVAEASDVGQAVTVEFSLGGAYAMRSNLWVFVLPTSVSGLVDYTTDHLTGSAAETLSPALPSGSGALSVGIAVADEYPGEGSGQWVITPPANALATVAIPDDADTTDQGNSTHATLSHVPQGESATWQPEPSNDTLLGWCWRMRLTT